MGYTTRFRGRFVLDRPLRAEHREYLAAFAGTRRVRRDPAVTGARPDPVRGRAGLAVGDEGGYFVGAGGMLGQEGGGPLFDPGGRPAPELGVLDFNAPPAGQPHVWCCWQPTEDGAAIHCPESGNHYEYASWLRYLVGHFLAPWGYRAAGKLVYEGEDASDHGELEIAGGAVQMRRAGGLGPSGEGMAAYERATSEYGARRIADAERWFALAHARAPSWSEPLWMRGICAGRLGRGAEARAALGAAIEIEPRVATRSDWRRRLQTICRSEGAAAEGLDRARVMRQGSRFETAIEEYEAYLAVVPDAERAAESTMIAVLGLGLACEGAGRLEDALARYQQAAAGWPHDPSGWTYGANLLAYRLERPKDAIPGYQKAIEAGNDSAVVWSELGRVLALSGHIAEAHAAYSNAVSADPADAIAVLNLGHTLLDLGRPGEALQCFTRALALGDPRVREHAQNGAEAARARLR